MSSYVDRRPADYCLLSTQLHKQGWRGSNPQSHSGDCLKDSPLCRLHTPPRSLEVGRSGPIRTGIGPFDGNTGLEPAALPLCYAPTEKCARRDSNSHCALFKSAASACLGHARGRYGRRDSNPQSPPSEDGVFAVYTTPARCWRGDSNPHRALKPRRSRRRAFAIYATPAKFFGRLRGEGSNPHDLLQRQASSL